MVSLMKIRPWYMPMVQPFGDDDAQDGAQSMGMNVFQKDNKVYIEAPIPGIPAENVEVTFTDGKIHIFAKSEEHKEEKDKKTAVYKMDRVSTFEYMTDIPTSIDEKTIEADVKDGVIYVTAKITEASKPKKITVKIKK
jgi:HSP20 family protein